MIVAVCEMKPKNARDGYLPHYKIPNFSKHPVNLDTNIGRGMAVYIHTSIDKSVIQIISELDFEEVCLLEIKLRGDDLLLFGCFYQSPTPSNNSEANNENLNQLLQRISNKSYSHKCFVGDFNFKDINWDSWTTFHNTESKEAEFIETARECYLHQHNQQVSRRRGNDDPSLIDLVFTDEAMQVSDVEHHPPWEERSQCDNF